MYQIGEYIVKPGTGVCKVEDVLHLDLMGINKKRLYYLLIPVKDPGEKLYIPTDSENAGLRKVMTTKEAEELIRRIPEIEELWVDNDKMREQKYKEVLKSGDPEELIRVIKNLYLRRMKRQKQGKKSTAVDERYYKQAENILYEELQIAMGTDREHVLQMIEAAV